MCLVSGKTIYEIINVQFFKPEGIATLRHEGCILVCNYDDANFHNVVMVGFKSHDINSHIFRECIDVILGTISLEKKL